MLLFDDALFNFSESYLPGKFLYWRTWVGIWTFVISLIVAAVQGSTLVQYFTKFIKDIFASLISLVFIYEAVNKLARIFSNHPLMLSTSYCDHYELINRTAPFVEKGNSSTMSLAAMEEEDVLYCDIDKPRGPQPNTALLSMILMFGTFFIAYFLRIFRNSQFLGRNVRRALGDFGVPIAIVIMVLVDYWAGDTYTEKLNVPEGLQVTNATARGWLISPLGKNLDNPLPIYAMFAAALPAILLYLLLFMETHIC